MWRSVVSGLRKWDLSEYVLGSEEWMLKAVIEYDIC